MLLGLTLHVKGQFPGKSIVPYLQETYFDEMGSSGFFRLMAASHAHVASLDFLNYKTNDEANYPPEVFSNAVRVLEDETEVDLLFAQISFEGAVEDEIVCTQKELEQAVMAGVLLSYKQFSLT